MDRKNSGARIDKSIKDLLNIDIDGDDSKSTSPRTREEILAWDLAVALKDKKGLPFYISCTKRYPEPLLRRVLAEVMTVPDEKIKKSRGALFNYLVQNVAGQTPMWKISDGPSHVEIARLRAVDGRSR